MESSFETPMVAEGANILLVDDQPRNLEVLEAILGTSDYQLVRALSGDQALMARFQQVTRV